MKRVLILLLIVLCLAGCKPPEDRFYYDNAVPAAGF